MPTLTDGKITSISYDGESIAAQYDDNGLTKVGNTDISGGAITGGGLDYTVTFMVDGEPYLIESVNAGGTITEPTAPTPETGIFLGWQIDGVNVTFPYTVNSDVVMTALISTVAHPELEYSGAGTPLWGTVTKTNDGTVILGAAFDSRQNLIRVSVMTTNPNTLENLAVTGGGDAYNAEAYSLSDGKTYYYRMYYSGVALPTHYVTITGNTPTQAQAQAMLDYYVNG